MEAHIEKYTKANWWDSVKITVLNLAIFYGLYYSLPTTITIYSIFSTMINALMIVKMFILFHDMAHYNFYPNNTVNWIMSLFFGFLVFTPVSFWSRGHNYHHQHSNDLDKKQFSQTAPLSVNKFKKLSKMEQIVYKLTFGKYTLFTSTPIIYFLFVQYSFAKWYEIIGQATVLLYVYSDLTYIQMLHILFSYILASSIGFVLFHIQHTFDGAYKESNEKWEFKKNAIHGCSFLQVPFLLKFFTAGIEYHHIHHLNSRVPCYNLKECHEKSGDLFKDVKRFYPYEIFKVFRYSLYNQEKQEYTDVYSV